ncbi:23 kDa jasmonate-induced protein [Phtheirospermum japonicum]|uniref:23 kDa jasmonate-induced protein n=1 Tax=Phtheirospermum japonicum TaxID=374723 RepID=A0A830BVM4_9LAMI|nr:23 kDa jasmonate-induced protein [Phtheirospermum japonicum]
MSTNVFGTPVTNATVQEIHIGLPAASITAQHRAEVALTYINSGGKADDARSFVADLKRQYGDGTSTLCTIYNATGNNLTFTRKNTWEGSVWRSPYPNILQNGQWGAFLHVRERLMGPSKEACMYRGQNLAGNAREWLLAWNVKRRDQPNKVYTEIRTNAPNWNTVNNNMKPQSTNHSATSLGCFSSVLVGSGSSPNYVAIMTLEGVNRDATTLATDVSAIFSSLDSQYKDDEGVDDSADATTPTE